VVKAQDDLMKARDERVALMNEVRSIIILSFYILMRVALDPWCHPHAKGISFVIA
jgi:hypothetical protein